MPRKVLLLDNVRYVASEELPVPNTTVLLYYQEREMEVLDVEQKMEHGIESNFVEQEPQLLHSVMLPSGPSITLTAYVASIHKAVFDVCSHLHYSPNVLHIVFLVDLTPKQGLMHPFASAWVSVDDYEKGRAVIYVNLKRIYKLCYIRAVRKMEPELRALSNSRHTDADAQRLRKEIKEYMEPLLSSDLTEALQHEATHLWHMSNLLFHDLRDRHIRIIKHALSRLQQGRFSHPLQAYEDMRISLETLRDTVVSEGIAVYVPSALHGFTGQQLVSHFYPRGERAAEALAKDYEDLLADFRTYFVRLLEQKPLPDLGDAIQKKRDALENYAYHIGPALIAMLVHLTGKELSALRKMDASAIVREYEHAVDGYRKPLISVMPGREAFFNFDAKAGELNRFRMTMKGLEEEMRKRAA